MHEVDSSKTRSLGTTSSTTSCTTCSSIRLFICCRTFLLGNTICTRKDDGWNNAKGNQNHQPDCIAITIETNICIHNFHLSQFSHHLFLLC
ncbi:hypothetical protein VIGAN_11231600 [Vigna angularis var. angularis]|uniref:Uncharacterized protein n=1 Tax=Vigna angularis var. angularis TaxID=157739 RepID=A0A0S3TCH0_PHAAN|nr:hypothetical protein VIGAN_11231600 [Vigna angularis var. angularis]